MHVRMQNCVGTMHSAMAYLGRSAVLNSLPVHTVCWPTGRGASTLPQTSARGDAVDRLPSRLIAHDRTHIICWISVVNHAVVCAFGVIVVVVVVGGGDVKPLDAPVNIAWPLAAPVSKAWPLAILTQLQRKMGITTLNFTGGFIIFHWGGRYFFPRQLASIHGTARYNA